MPPDVTFLRVTAAARPHPNRRTLARAALFALAGLLICSSASGYRFFWKRGSSRVPVAEDAPKWSAEAWPAGAVLEWVLVDSPLWTEPFVDQTDGETYPAPFENTADALPFLREAMAAWSAIPTADLRMRLSGIGPGPGWRAEDGRNTISIEIRDDFEGGVADHWARRTPSGWRIYECDFVLTPGAAAVLDPESEPAKMMDSPYRYTRNLYVTIHEMGHCLGLDHSYAYSNWIAWHDREGTDVLGETPKLSYGYHISHTLTVDDMVGVSLLRPAGDFAQRTGAISGRVTISGSPTRFAAVASVRLGEEGTTPGPSVFTDEDGSFLLEGLIPGEYLIRAGPMLKLTAHPRLIEAGAPVLPAADVARLSPVTVRADEVTGELSLVLPPGRQSTERDR